MQAQPGRAENNLSFLRRIQSILGRNGTFTSYAGSRTMVYHCRKVNTLLHQYIALMATVPGKYIPRSIPRLLTNEGVRSTYCLGHNHMARMGYYGRILALVARMNEPSRRSIRTLCMIESTHYSDDTDHLM